MQLPASLDTTAGNLKNLKALSTNNTSKKAVPLLDYQIKIQIRVF